MRIKTFPTLFIYELLSLIHVVIPVARLCPVNLGVPGVRVVPKKHNHTCTGYIIQVRIISYRYRCIIQIPVIVQIPVISYMYRLHHKDTGYNVPVTSYRYQLYHTGTSYNVCNLKHPTTTLSETKKILRHAVKSNLTFYGIKKILSKITFTVITLECVFFAISLFYMALHSQNRIEL